MKKLVVFGLVGLMLIGLCGVTYAGLNVFQQDIMDVIREQDQRNAELLGKNRRGYYKIRRLWPVRHIATLEVFAK